MRMRTVAAVAAGASAIWLAVPFSASARASMCAYATPAQQLRQAQVVFVGIALNGWRTPTGIQRFRVGRYVKGSGPHIARIVAGIRMAGFGIQASAGERWRIYAQKGKKGVFYTSTCAGSHRLARAPHD